MPLLSEPSSGLLDRLDVGEPMPHAPRIPTVSTSSRNVVDPMVELADVQTLDAYAALGIAAARPMMLRAEGLRRLQQANRALPPGFALVVLDAWRSIVFQEELLDYYSRVGPVSGYVSDPASTVLRPPHVTGGAVDITLGYAGAPLALGSDFDAFEAVAHLDSYEAQDGVVRRLRRLLASVMTKADFAPYPYEWWHWSYGDDVWASWKGTEALYDLVPGGADIADA